MKLIGEEQIIPKRGKIEMVPVMSEMCNVNRLKLVNDTEIRHKRGIKDIRCRLCRSSNTKVNSNNFPIWIKDRDSEGDHTGDYICYKCAYESQKSCYMCGANNKLIKHYDNKNYWTGRYICSKCFPKKKLTKEKG